MNRSRRKVLKLSIGALGAGSLRSWGDGAPEPLADSARRLLLALHARSLDPFLAAWPPSGAVRRAAPPSSVAVLRYLPELAAGAKPFCAGFVQRLAAEAPKLPWRQSYSSAQVGAAFLENYGWAELAGLTGETPSEQLACGVLLLGPSITYPSHRHEAEEVYVPLVGRALWQRGGGRFMAKDEGAVIHHARFEPHAMRTQASPLLALYLWRSRNLAQKSQLMPTSE